MEIERKFLIQEFPNLPLFYRAHIEQGYLSIDPEIRIRSTKFLHEDSAPLNHERTEYILCIKSNGTLCREEIEIPLPAKKFGELKKMLGKDMIPKEYGAFSLNGAKLECSTVDKGSSTEFSYAEIEFGTEDQAKAFIPPDFLGKEVTYDKSWKMKNYWKRTRIEQLP